MLPFYKYQGLGNDFVIAELGAVSSAWVREICDRHTGVGADGVLALEAAARVGSPRRLTIHNADGSTSAMCGNGLRCVASYLFDEGLVPEGATHVDLEVEGRVHRVERLDARTFRSNLGAVRPNAPDVLAHKTQLNVGGATLDAVGWHVGNPHAVIVCDTDRDERLWTLARQLKIPVQHPSFPAGVNVSFVRWQGAGATGEAHAVVVERGVGITLACGSGAAAIAATCIEAGLAKAEQEVWVTLPGGRLSVTIADDGVRVVGPAERVFRGEWL